MIKILVPLLALLCVSSSGWGQNKSARDSSQSKDCLLEGGGHFELICQDAKKLLTVEMSGQDGEELNANSVKSGAFSYKSDPETEVPLLSFERTDEGVFTALLHAKNTYLRITGIPKSFRTKESKLAQPPNSIEETGTFSAHVRGLLNLDDEKSRVEVNMACKFTAVRCAR